MPLNDSNKTDNFDRTEVGFSNDSLDAFGRLRVSEPVSLFDCTFQYNKAPTIFSELVTSGGSVTHDANLVSSVLACTAANGSSAIFQSRRYFRYHPGKSQVVMLTGTFDGASANVIKRFGQFDDDNGFYFELNGNILSAVIRSSTSGAVVNTVIPQSSWNLDKLDGTGRSQSTIDVTKQILFIIDYQWLGSGRVRFGFNVGGSTIYVHEQSHGNILEIPYSQTATLPIRTEIRNNGTTAATLKLTCCTVFSEGGWAPNGIMKTAFNQSARTFSGTNVVLPLVAIRKKAATLNIPVETINFGMFSVSGDDFILQIVKNPTINGGSWVSNGDFTEYNLTGTSITGGEVIYSQFYRGATSVQAISSDVLRSVESAILGSDLNGNSEVICVVARNITNNATAFGFINYKESV